MMTSGRSIIAAFVACLILLILSAPAYPSYNTEAGHKYSIASQRLANLRKSHKKKKYRSYWMDCVRTFELVEKKYPRSPSAADACFDRAALYFELYRISRYSPDLDQSMHSFAACQSAYPRHAKAPKALYRIVDLSVAFRKNQSEAAKAYSKMTESYSDSAWTGKAKARLGLLDKKSKRGGKATASRKRALPRTVKSIRYWSGGAYTRIVIDQDKPVKFRAYELKAPDRLVFDLENSRIAESVDRDPLPVNDGILKQVRTSQYDPNTVRVVLDLASIKSYAAFPLHDPDRLVIDVTGEDGTSEPAAAVATGGSGTPLETKAEAPSGEKGTQEKETARNAALVGASSQPDSGERLSLSRQLGLKVRTIAIDAGHGGHDPGAIGKNGLREKSITLDIAKRLAVLVKDRIGCNIIMTRDKDVFIPLEQRPFIAKSKNADLFVSIHVNATRKRSTRGIETYIQGLRASDRDAMATAARENATTSKTLNELDDELSKILKGLRMESNDEDSIQLAHAVQTSLVDSVKPIQKRTVNLGVKRAFFYVLINTGMPSILAEVGFISNPQEEKMLRKESYRQHIAEALFQGVKKYMDRRSPQMVGI